MIPVMQDRVRIGGSEEAFLVVGVDYARRVVDIISTSGEGSVIEDIPFDRLELQSVAQQPVGAGRPATE
jgi:hypothetical protein